MSAYSAAVLASSGLVSYWRLGESSGTSVADAKGANTGTTSGSPTQGAASLLAGDTGNTAYSFDGVDDTVSFGNPAGLQLSTSTVRIWVKTTDAGFIGLAWKPSAWYIWMSGGTLGCYDFGAGANRFSSAVINDGRPHMVELKYVSASVNGSRLLVDGVSAGAFTMTIAAQTSPIALGTGETFFPGVMDEMAIWSSVVPDATSLADYTLGITAPDSVLPGLLLPV